MHFFIFNKNSQLALGKLGNFGTIQNGHHIVPSINNLTFPFPSSTDRAHAIIFAKDFSIPSRFKFSFKMKRFKCVIAGDPETGKSSLIRRYSKGIFETIYHPTSCFEKTVIQYFEGKAAKLELECWDIGVNSRNFQKLFSQADLVLLCFSVVSPSSFTNIETHVS